MTRGWESLPSTPPQSNSEELGYSVQEKVAMLHLNAYGPVTCVCHLFGILEKKNIYICPEKTMLNVSKSGLESHDEVQSVVFGVKLILTVQL